MVDHLNSEQIALGRCPTCGGPAQFVAEGAAGRGNRVNETRHVDLRAVPLDRVLEQMRVSRDAMAEAGMSGPGPAAFGEAMSIVETELTQVRREIEARG